jgi:hypothetical protein
MSNNNESKKFIEYQHMKELYEGAYQSAMNTLFKANFEKHGWRYDDFMEEYSKEEELIDFMIDPHATLH